MIFDVKFPILGFETTTKVRLERGEGGFATLHSVDGEQPFSIRMLSPYEFSNTYEFELPSYYDALLQVTASQNIELYAALILNQSIERSSINLLAPIILNFDNHTMAQIVLDSKKYPEFSPTQAISDLLEKL